MLNDQSPGLAAKIISGMQRDSINTVDVIMSFFSIPHGSDHIPG
jgi:hypothetical protein